MGGFQLWKKFRKLPLNSGKCGCFRADCPNVISNCPKNGGAGTVPLLPPSRPVRLLHYADVRMWLALRIHGHNQGEILKTAIRIQRTLCLVSGYGPQWRQNAKRKILECVLIKGILYSLGLSSGSIHTRQRDRVLLSVSAWLSLWQCSCYWTCISIFLHWESHQLLILVTDFTSLSLLWCKQHIVIELCMWNKRFERSFVGKILIP